MKKFKLIKITALLLSVAVVLTSFLGMSATATTTENSSAIGKVDDWSMLTLDALGARYKSYDDANSGRINGVKLGEAQGITLEAGKTYTLTFDYRIDEIIRPDSGETYGNSYSCRTPIIYFYKDGKNPTTVNFNRYKADGTFEATQGFQNPWNMTVGKWYAFSMEFTTASSIATNATWFAPITYGGMKSSYRSFAIVDNATAETTYYSIEKMQGISAYADINTPTYNDVNKNSERSFPEVKISRSIARVAVDTLDNWSTLTLDALGSRFRSYDDVKTGRVNGIKLGEAQGIHLEAGKTYTLNFDYRIDEIIRPDSGENYGNSYSCRTPIIYFYKDGMNPSTVNFAKYAADGTTYSTAGNQNPWNMTVGKWYAFSMEFTTASSVATNATWFAPISYGGMKSSYRSFAITDNETNETTYYSIEKLNNISAYANVNIPTYNDKNQNSELSFPEIKIGRNSTKADITLDGTGARFASYDSAKSGRVNGVKLGTAQGIDLKAATTYTVTFDYRIDARIDPTGEDKNGKPDTGLAWGCRTPIIFVYKDGQNPTTVNFNRYKSDGTFETTQGFQNPWNMTIGEWYTFTMEFTTADTVAANATWIAPISYGGMKSSYRNFSITPSNGESVTYYFGDSQLNYLYTATYNDINQNAEVSYPEIIVSKKIEFISDFNEDGKVNILDLIYLKKAVGNGSLDLNSTNIASMRKYLIGAEA